jgi:hypothetical protein
MCIRRHRQSASPLARAWRPFQGIGQSAGHHERALPYGADERDDGAARPCRRTSGHLWPLRSTARPRRRSGPQLLTREDHIDLPFTLHLTDTAHREPRASHDAAPARITSARCSASVAGKEECRIATIDRATLGWLLLVWEPLSIIGLVVFLLGLSAWVFHSGFRGLTAWLLLALALASAYGCAVVPGQIVASPAAVAGSPAR